MTIGAGPAAAALAASLVSIASSAYACTVRSGTPYYQRLKRMIVVATPSTPCIPHTYVTNMVVLERLHNTSPKKEC